MLNKRPLINTSLVLMCMALVPHFFAQQPNNAFTLQQAIEYAVKNSPNQLNSDLDLQNSTYRKNEIRAAGLPQVSGSIDIKDYLEIPTSLFPQAAFNPFAGPDDYTAVKFGLQYNATAGVSASQLIFSADYMFGMKAANEFINLSRISIQRSKTDLTAQVAKAYYAVLIAKIRLRSLDANIEKLNRSLEELKAYNKQGMVELIDVERVEVTGNNLANEREKVVQLMGIGETMLKFQMGYKVNEAIILSDSINITDDLKQEMSTLAGDISKRPDYQLMKAQIHLNELDLGRQKWGYLPTLAAYGSYQYNSQRNSTNFFETDKTNAMKQWYPIALVGITMNVNIFDGLSRHNKIQQAKVSLSKNNNNMKTIELLSQMETSVAAINYNNALKSLRINERSLELAKHVYDVAQKKYQQGIGNNLELVNAQTSLRESEVNYYGAVYDAIIAKIDHQKATGTLVK